MSFRRVLLVIALAAALGLGLVPAFGAGPSATFKPPYRAGPKGGDQYNLVTADPGSGRVSVARVSPYPGAFSCSGSGGFAYLRLTPVVTGPVTSVAAQVSKAAVDGYSWVSVLVRDGAGNWLGSKKVRGPLVGTSTVTVPVVWSQALVGQPLVIDVGLEVASACPNVDGGTAQFSSVVVNGSVAAPPSPPAPSGAGGGGGGGRPAVAAPSSVITTVNFEFEPGDEDPPADIALPLRVVAGTGLAYVNADTTAPHTVTAVAVDAAGHALFDSGAPINAGQAALVKGVEHLKAGRYDFYCKVHTQMRGVLEVVG